MQSDYGDSEVVASPNEKDNPVESLRWDTLEISLPARFERCVEAFSDRPAVVDDSDIWSYDRLNRAANRIAHKLLTARGQEPEPIALLFEQGANFLASVFGVLKTGKFFVPLDPLFPDTRNAYILKDSGAPLLLSDTKHLLFAEEISARHIPVLNVESCNSAADESDPGLPTSPEALCMLIYTSGSTGQPKGVLHNHVTLIHNAIRQNDPMHFVPTDRLSMLYSSSVMGTVRDFTNTLLNGASLYPFDVRAKGLTGLVDFLINNKITVLHTISSVFRKLDTVLDNNKNLSTLRFIILGGEAVLRSDFEIYQRKFSDSCRLFTGLGMTETGTIRQNILTASSVVEHSTVPLGFPVRDMEILLLDVAGQPVKTGEVGEIAVRSPYIALEYWKKPDETRSDFITDPDNPERRIFLTGDMGELLPDGCLIHKGRKDFQIKLRGFRIELQEIEAVIMETDLVKDVVVVGHDIRPGEKRLVAYIIPKEGIANTADMLRSRVNKYLPDHMNPSFYIELESLPLTPNGKVDRQALPSPDFSYLSGDLGTPADDVEVALVELWKEIFHLERVGLDDNFFELGGDSLIASVLFVEINRRFGRLYPLSLLIEKNTIRKLAGVLRDPNTGITHSLVAIKAEGNRPPLFIIPGGYGDTLYLRRLAKYIHPEQPLYGIQSADLDKSQPHLPKVEEIAAQYLMEIAEAQLHGPYLLGGHSFGGYIALEMARLLLKRGEQVSLLVMIDTYPPGQRKNASLKDRFLIHYDNLRPMNGKQRLEYLNERWNQIVFRLARNGRISRFLRRTISPTKRHFAVSRMARYNYDPAPYPGNLLLIQASERPPYMNWDPMEKWPSYITGNFQTYTINGRHDSILFEPYVQELAIILEQQIAEVLANP